MVPATVTSTRIDLGWVASADEPGNVDGYDVYINNQYIGNLPRGTVSSSISGLVCNTSYSIYLRATRQTVQSTNSNTVSTTTGGCGNVTPGTPTPTLIASLTPTPTSTNPPMAYAKFSPANGAGSLPTNLVLSWGGGSDAGYYLVCYDTVNNNSCDRFWTAVYTTSTTISGLDPGAIYYWEVVAVRPSGALFLDNNNWWSFSLTANPSPATVVPGPTNPPYIPPTPTPTAIPSLTAVVPTGSPSPTTSPAPVGAFTKLAPVNFQSGVPTSAVLSWAGVSGANYYIYCIDTINNGACDSSWVISYSTSGGVSGLTAGASYYWEVVAIIPYQAVFADGGAWWSFVVSGSAPTLTPLPATATTLPSPTRTPIPSFTQPGPSLTPSPTATTGGGGGGFTKLTPLTDSAGNPASLTLTWGSLAGVSYYMFCYDLVNNNSCDTFWTVSSLTNASLRGLTPGATYYWQVLAVNPPSAVFANGGTWWNFSVAR